MTWGWDLWEAIPANFSEKDANNKNISRTHSKFPTSV